jgi:hypothetical protein
MPLSIRPSPLVALAITVCMGTIGPLGTPSDATAQQRPDCENFLDQEDAQVAFDADPTDPLGLDEAGQGDSEACESDAAFGTPRSSVATISGTIRTSRVPSTTIR